MIFHGIEIMFFLLGVCTTLGVMLMVRYAKKYILKWSFWVPGIIALMGLLFTIAWSWSSVLEKEPQAAGMGLIFFGIPSLILGFVSRRMLLKSEEK